MSEEPTDSLSKGFSMDEPFPELDLVSEPTTATNALPESTSAKPKPFLGVLFACCNVYARLSRPQRRCVLSRMLPQMLQEDPVHRREGGRRDQFFRAQ
ncbi:MAG: hypothetical protein R3C05_18995 [Pirellulaceae bacterium]